MIKAIADQFQLAYVVFSPSMASYSQAGVHCRTAVEHLHLTDMPFILRPLLISCMRLGLLAGTSRQLQGHLYQFASQLFQLVLDLLLHGLLEAISYLDSLVF